MTGGLFKKFYRFWGGRKVVLLVRRGEEDFFRLLVECLSCESAQVLFGGTVLGLSCLSQIRFDGREWVPRSGHLVV